MFILIGATVFLADVSWRHRRILGRASPDLACPAATIGFLIFVNVFVFVLAFFLDFFELAFISPADARTRMHEQLGIDLIWFGVMLGVNMQTSFMHPPFGFALFYLRSVAPRASRPITGKELKRHDRPDLLGCRALRRHPGHHGGDRDRFPGRGDRTLTRRSHGLISSKVRI